MGKRILSMCLALCMVMSVVVALPITVNAETSGKCGNNVYWSLDNGTLTISGLGDMYYYSRCSEVPWYNSNISVKKAIIESGVTTISNFAFCGCNSLTSITIPDSVTSIGMWTFDDCTSLISITVVADNPNYSSLNGNLYNKNKTKLIQYAIGKKDTSFSIPDSVTSIGECAFLGCESLTSITIPDSVTSIGCDAFFCCESLKSVTIPDSVTSIGYGAFRYCNNLKDVYYSGTKEQWKKIRIDFYNSSLTYATIHYNSTGPEIMDYTSNSTHIWLNGNDNRRMQLTPGQVCRASISSYPLSAYPTSGVTWHSTNPSVATVSQNGTVTAIAEGHTNVYLTTSGGITSDVLPVTVTDLSKYTKSATDKVSKIGFGSNYNWLTTADNFMYWRSFVNNDTNAAKYYFQNYVCAPLFDTSEFKNLYSGVCSKDRAKEILLSFISETYDDAYEKIEKDTNYKLAEKTNKYLKTYLENNAEKDYASKIELLGKDKIQALFNNCDLDSGVNGLANYLDSANPEKARTLISNWILSDCVGDLFSCVSDVIDITNDMGAIKNELMQLQLAAQTNESYGEMLDYLAENCIDRNVRAAALEIRQRMQRSYWQNLGALTADMAVKNSIDEVTKEAVKKVVDTLSGGSLFIKIGYEMGILVSNELLHAKDYLKCGDNIRLLSYISVAMTSKLTSTHLAFNMTNDEYKKEQYAQELIEQYNLLISARKLGEENYKEAYGYNPVNWEAFRKLFNMQYDDIDAWYNNVSDYLDGARNNPEKTCTYTQVTKAESGGTFSLKESAPVSLISTQMSTHMNTQGGGTPYTADEFYALFGDKGFANAVLYSLGTSKDNTDWSIVTKEAVEGLTQVFCNEDNSVSDITGISNLKSLKYLNLANQKVHNIPDEITQLENLEFISLFNNGIMTYPQILNNIPSLKQLVLSYNLLTDVSSISDELTVELSGNLLDTSVHLAQRYLYSDKPIVYSNDTKLTDVVKLRDMYGIVYDYNGDSIGTEGNTADGSITAVVNSSTNPNARMTVLADILDATGYTKENFKQAFPDEKVREGVLAEFGMTEENADYSKITEVSLAEISECTIIGASDLTGVELLKGVNSLDIEQCKITSIPSDVTQLINLQQLTLKGSDITTLNGISKLKNLMELDISDCASLADISELGNLKTLEKLYADGIGQSEILNIIKDISTLKLVSVLGNNISDITPIVNNTYDYLNIGGNTIEESVFESADFKTLQSNCKAIVYSPQNLGLIKSISNDGNTVNVTVENDTGIAYEKLVLYIAIYRDGKMIGIKETDVSDFSNAEKIDLGVEFNDLSSVDEVKVFLWTKDLQSVTKNRQITVEE